MNCQRFQDELFDYLDGSLSASEQSEAEAHEEQCAACRQLAQAHQVLGARFQREAGFAAVRPEFKRRLEAALLETAADRVQPFWRRLAWPAAMAAALAVAAGLTLRGPPRGRAQKNNAAPTPAAASIFMRDSYCNPTYLFRREKNNVVDALICAPHVVEENLSLTLNQHPVPPAQERITPL
jgi:anti-sigma-K factor RskA